MFVESIRLTNQIIIGHYVSTSINFKNVRINHWRCKRVEQFNANAANMTGKQLIYFYIISYITSYSMKRHCLLLNNQYKFYIISQIVEVTETEINLEEEGSIADTDVPISQDTGNP